mmetsp:Transcript_20122/g.33225  ORF Transcript_20122/g.33225 Transcript_20122/m.33225 type:complete len:502 (-) Transcript_20122:57-1562(-)
MDDEQEQMARDGVYRRTSTTDRDDQETDGLTRSGTCNEDVCQQIIDELGFGRFNYTLFCISGTGWATDVALIFSSGVLIPVLKKEFEVESDSQIALIGSFTFAGMLVGSWVFGSMGDVLGRRPAFLWTSAFTFLFGVLTATAHNLSTFLGYRFMVGFFLGGNLPVDFSLFLEWTPRHLRDKATLWLTGWSVVGTLFASLLGTFTLQGDEPRWRLFLVIVALPSALAMFFRPFIPESPRFLICADRGDDCADALLSVAAMNKVDLSQDLLSLIRSTHPISFDSEHQDIEYNKRSCFGKILFTIRQSLSKVPALFEDWKSSFTTILLLFIWISSSLGFYSMQLWAPTMMTDASGDKNITFRILTITSLFQFVSLVFAVWINDKVGLAYTLAMYLLLDSISIILFWLFPSTTGMFISYALFNMGCAGFFGVLYLFTNVCYATTIRTTGFGFCAASNRLGGIIAPVLAGHLYHSMGRASCVFFGLFFFISSMLALVASRRKAGSS